MLSKCYCKIIQIKVLNGVDSIQEIFKKVIIVQDLFHRVHKTAKMIIS